MSPLTPYSPGLPILQPGGVGGGAATGGDWEEAVDVNLKVQQGSRWSGGLHSDLYALPPHLSHDGQPRSSIGALFI